MITINKSDNVVSIELKREPIPNPEFNHISFDDIKINFYSFFGISQTFV